MASCYGSLTLSNAAGRALPSRHSTLSDLISLDALKTWSLVVTVFGDLDGEALSGAQIRKLLGHIDIKPEAIRVALHRLKTDGWITSTRSGREAVYRMSQTARVQAQSAAPGIYQRWQQQSASQWHFQLFEESPTGREIILLNKNLALVAGPPSAPGEQALSLTPQTTALPDWIERQLVAEHLIRLATRLQPLVAFYSDLTNSLDQIAFRLLILHHWRRIALRRGSWAHASLLPDGPIARCHDAVNRFLASTDRITEHL